MPMKASATYTATIDGEETGPFTVSTPPFQKQLRIPPIDPVLVVRRSRSMHRHRHMHRQGGRVYAFSGPIPLE